MSNEEQFKKLSNLRKYTKDKYHLGIEDDTKNITWSLYRNYIDQDVFMSEDNKAIMTSKTNTIEELEKYLKEHYEKDFLKVFTKTSLFIMITLWLSYIVILPICKRSDYFAGFLLGGLVINWIYLMISYLLDQQHYDVLLKELLEEGVKLDKRIYAIKNELPEEIEVLEEENNESK